MADSPFAMHLLQPRQTQSPGSNRDRGSNSASGIVSTLVPTFLVAVIVFTAFLIFRAKSARVYRPRTLNTLVKDHELTPRSDTSFFGSLKNFRTIPDELVLQHNSLDGFLFLRFFKVLIIICFVGCCLTWPILFPVNATGGAGQSELDILTFSNVANPNRYYAHALVAWIFLGFVVLVILHERMYFIGLRQAYFLSNFQAQRLSSRVVLFMTIPEKHASESALSSLLGSDVTKIWFAKDTKQLEKDLKERDKASTKLENGLVKLSRDANKQRLKVANGKVKDSNLDPSDSTKPLTWIDPKNRPTHKLKFLIGEKVDTINWCRAELPRMSENLERSQKDALKRTDTNVSAAFVEFRSQAAAQHALQLVAQKPRKEMHPRYIGVNPSEVVWNNLSISLTQRKLRMAVATALVWLMIIFWAIPVAFVGILTNVNYIIDKVPFLSFIGSIPSVILGVITGLLPAVLLAVLVALVPIICRLLAKLGGEPTLSAIELKTQNWYFAFQVIQVFLITTFTSGASAVVTNIVDDPTSAPSLLATNLPKASNFYLSYFVIYGLGQATMQLLSIAPFLMIVVLGKFLDKTPRKQYNRWLKMVGLGWGSEYPKWTNLGVIALSYSCISPLVLGFATIGFLLLYLAFRYKWLFIYGNQVDMKGEAYARAIKQLLTGVYLSALCLIGLFAIGASGNAASAGPLVLMIIFFVVLVAVHVLSNIALNPLEKYLPLDMLEHEPNVAKYHSDDQEQYRTDIELGAYDDSNPKKINTHSPNASSDTTPFNPHNPANMNRTDSDTTRIDSKPKENKLTVLARKFAAKQYSTHRSQIQSWSIANNLVPEYDDWHYDSAYYNPALFVKRPVIWLAKDGCGVSELSVRENTKAGVESSDDHAWFNEKNKVEWDTERPTEAPIYREHVRY